MADPARLSPSSSWLASSSLLAAPEPPPPSHSLNSSHDEVERNFAMAPSSPKISSVSTSQASAADMQAELQYLRQRNKELETQLLGGITKRGDSEAFSHDEVDKEGMACSSSSLDGGIELAERNHEKEPVELARSISIDGKPPDGLHHRRSVSGKENSGDNVEHARSISVSSPLKRRGYVKAKASDVGLIQTIKNNGHSHLNSPATVRSREEAGFDNECNEVHFSRSKGTKKASDGGGDYFPYEPPLLVEIHRGDEEESALCVQNCHESDQVDESDDFIHDDSSHNKHHSKIIPVSPCSVTSSSSSFPPFKDQVKERAGWLIGLLFLQSCSSFIIQYNQNFLQSHMVIVQFLTMLVGAGGNAGNQASVRVIRSLAVGTLNRHTMKQFLQQEAKMALCLSALIGTTGFIRAAMFRTPPGETIAVTASVCAIVAISVAIGSTLPLGMKKVGIDPANSSTSIQVIMDILGVLITVCVSSFVLSFKIFQNDDSGD
mmetsp:Transcript_54058/g.114810  ORF Transcript_54058/g.114810 Transcript_54058/m.114810 type:complete len:491 (+) Transcript_54058:5-1477(+)